MKERRRSALLVASCLAALAAIVVLYRAAPRKHVQGIPFEPAERGSPNRGESIVVVTPGAVEEALGRKGVVQGPVAAPSHVAVDRTRIHVRERGSLRPIGSAEVCFVSAAGGSRVELGRTNAEGNLTVTLPALSGEDAWLLVTAPGYAREQVQLSSSHPPRVTIELSAEASITGRVVREGGRPVGPGLLVLAVPVSERLRRVDDVTAVLRGAHAGGAVRTDVHGGFHISGLSAGVPHVLLAGGKGLLSCESVTGLPRSPGQGEFEILVKPIIGLLLAPRAADGAGFPPSAVGTDEFGVFVAVDGAEVRPIPEGPAYAARLMLADILPESLELRNPMDVLYLGFPVDENAALPRVTYGIHIPGYTVASGSLVLRRAVEGVTRHEIRLTPTGEATGVVRVVFRDSRAVSAGPMVVAPARLVLRRLSDDLTIHRDVDSFEERVEILLPAGPYEARLQTCLTSDRPAIGTPQNIEFDVGPGRAPEVEFDLSRTGSIWTRVRSPSGAEFGGWLGLSLGKKIDGRLRRRGFTFSSAPYRLVGLPEGDYTVTIDWPGNSSEFQTEEQSTVHVAPGTETTLELVFDERGSRR